MANLPLIGWLDDIVNDAFRNVYEGLNKEVDEYLRSKDIFRKGRAKYSRYYPIDTAMSRFSACLNLWLFRICIRLRVNRKIRSRLFLDELKLRNGDAKYLRCLMRERQKDSVDPMSLVHGNRRILLLGRRGSGKTTFLKYLSLVFSGNVEVGKNIPRCFPFMVPFRSLSGAGRPLGAC